MAISTPLWHFEPNWKLSPFEGQTGIPYNIHTSRYHREQRATPFQEEEFALTMTIAYSARRRANDDQIGMFLRSQPGTNFLVPMYFDPMPSKNTAYAGAPVAPDTSPTSAYGTLIASGDIPAGATLYYTDYVMAKPALADYAAPLAPLTTDTWFLARLDQTRWEDTIEVKQIGTWAIAGGSPPYILAYVNEASVAASPYNGVWSVSGISPSNQYFYFVREMIMASPPLYRYVTDDLVDYQITWTSPNKK